MKHSTLEITPEMAEAGWTPVDSNEVWADDLDEMDITNEGIQIINKNGLKTQILKGPETQNGDPQIAVYYSDGKDGEPFLNELQQYDWLDEFIVEAENRCE